MSDPAAEEIERIVAEAQASAPPDDDDGDGDTEEASPPKKRRVVRAKKKNDDNGTNRKARTIDDLDRDAELLLDGVRLPKPSENVKTLDDMYAKYKVGDNPDFKIQVYRTYPKIAPGGRKFDGYYDTWDIPIGLDLIQSEYGGGQYRIAVVGPHPSNPRLTTKHYDSLPVQLAGDPKWERMPNALKGRNETSDDGQSVQMPTMPMMENPKLSETALKMATSMADQERSERHRMEERLQQERAESRSMMGPAVEAERRRADDLIVAERSKAESERRFLEERLAEERLRTTDERRATEELRSRMERMEAAERTRPSAFSELREVAPLFQKDDSTAKEMLNSVLEKHRMEMDNMQRTHQAFVESLRSGHASEVGSMREAHRREIEAEREASRSRESRIEDRLNNEREERRRDQERFRQTQEERDRGWNDRLVQAKEMVEQSWQARHNTLLSAAETRNQYLQTELDRAKQEIVDLRSKREEAGDPLTQIRKMADMRTAVRELTGEDSKSSSSGGIGITGGDGDWKQVAVTEGLERAPELIDKIGDLLSGRRGQGPSPQQQQQQYQPGQEVQTPQGLMVVVVAPNGQLALTPKAAFEAAQKQAGGRLLQQPKPRVMPDVDDIDPSQGRKDGKFSAVPNFADGLPKQRPPWEGGGMEQRQERAPGAPPRSVTRGPRMTSRSTSARPAEDEPMQLTMQQRQVLDQIAKAVHRSVMEADEPEEFVARVMQEYPAPVLKQIAGYTTADIQRGIVQVQPQSAGATPAGQQFVRDAFKALRRALAG